MRRYSGAMATSFLLAVLVSSYNFTKHADATFGDQHFKTAIALTELYRIRHNTYPESLANLDFVGDWDKIAIGSVKYERIGDGYALDVTKGWIGEPTLTYPPEFWRGLGIKKTNMKP